MATSAELNIFTVKELGAIAKELAVPGWHEMRKEDLVRALVQKSRSKTGRDTIQKRLAKRKKPPVKAVISEAKTKKKTVGNLPATVIKTNRSASPKTVKSVEEHKKETPKRRKAAQHQDTRRHQQGERPLLQAKDRTAVLISSTESQNERLVLLVRDPYWLHVFWELNSKTLKRAEVAMGHFWHSAVPVLRLYRVLSDGSSSPKRQLVRDIRIHGGVNNWYLDVDNPPTRFQVELGYLSREKKFYSLVSSNTVETPQRQIVDELDKLDGNWRGVADDLGRIYKLSGGDGNNQELKKVFEDQLRRPMSGPMLSRYRASQGGIGEKTRRNFDFNIDADVIIHGKTDPSVQVTIRNEPIKINPDGTFSVRFSLPEKRHVFSVEAEGSDGVEMQRVVLTVERNTRILETLFQEPSNED